MEVFPGFSPAPVVVFIWLHTLKGTLSLGDYQLGAMLLFFRGSSNVSVLAALGRDLGNVSFFPGCGRQLLCHLIHLPVSWECHLICMAEASCHIRIS